MAGQETQPRDSATGHRGLPAKEKEQLRIKKGINIPAGKTRADILPQILAGENLQINITSEMKSCDSCQGIVTALEKKSIEAGSPTRANVSYGVRYEK